MPLTGQAKRQYQSEWMLARRQEWLAEHGPCCVCGSAEQLEVHHREPALKVDHKVWSWAKARRDAELAKCEVRCRPCHKLAHDQRPAVPEGTRARYRQGCRCAACRQANIAYESGRRERLRAEQPTPHGTLKGYDQFGCRCDACRAAQAAYFAQRQRRAKGVADVA